MPSLLLGDTVVINNLGAHKGKIARRAIRPELFFLSPTARAQSIEVSAKLNSERPPSNRKHNLEAQRCLAGPLHARECANYLVNAAYAST
ncbi:hypothetical protein ABH995_000970 [Bradyrhizobium yuanmingense]|uniref:hypothetical protein n=1 Tax=Bradyrhizobium yuanmingense TaxID=108015 RepID=UPI0035135383